MQYVPMSADQIQLIALQAENQNTKKAEKQWGKKFSDFLAQVKSPRLANLTESDLLQQLASFFHQVQHTHTCLIYLRL